MKKRMEKETLIEYCKSLNGAMIDQPFRKDSSTYIARHDDSRKWFAAIMERDSKVFINLKCDPNYGDFLRSVYKGITAAYHMNKWHWISVYIKSDVPDEMIMQLILDSFRLTENKKK
ncbi:MAG: MmcQ/YjbR family DNA-binding protein [Dehalobacterium sp.]